MYDYTNKTFKELAQDINFWRQLNPELTITEYAQSDWGPFKLTAQLKKDIRESLIEEGYFQLPAIFDPTELKKMADAVAVLNREQWPSVFCFVYDEFWHFQDRFKEILSEMLGKQYALMPNFWVFYINPDNESKGWAPHRDRQKILNLKNDGSPLSMVLWTPLTDANPLNGCMYILPAHRDPYYNTDLSRQGVDNLQDIRALPVPVGSAVGWNETVFHWGARASKRAAGPRIAISTSYQSTEVGAFETPLIKPGQLLRFETRVGLIAQQFHRFIVQHTFPPAVAQLATDLAPLLSDNVRILDDRMQYWDIVDDTTDSIIDENLQFTAKNQLPTPPRDFEKGRGFNPELEETKHEKNGRAEAEREAACGDGDESQDGNGSDSDSMKSKGWLGKLKAKTKGD